MGTDSEQTVREGRWHVSPSEFQHVRKLARSTFGLDLKDGKEALVSARLNKRMRALGLDDVAPYLKLVETDTTGQELLNLVDALTTNYTAFRREPAHFDLLRTAIVEDLPRQGEIRIWSAGCATGEEPYSIVMELLSRMGVDAAPRIKLLASDISGRVLAHAQAGVYKAEKLREIPAEWRRFLEKGAGEREGYFRVASAWKNLIEFRRINLMEPFDHLAKFHIIFCRNVMIYFDRPTQEDLVGRFTTRLEPGGWLLIGHSEGLSGLRSNLRYIQPATYRRSG